MGNPGHVTLAAFGEQSLVILEQNRILAEPQLLDQRFDPVPYGHRIAANRRQNLFLADEIVLDQIADPIVETADPMERALGMFAAPARAELFPRQASQLVQEKKLIMLKLGALPDFEEMGRDGEVIDACRLAKLKNHRDSARGEGHA